MKLKLEAGSTPNQWVANQQIAANHADSSSMLLTMMIREFAETLIRLAANENPLTDSALTNGYAMLDRIVKELKGEIEYLDLVRKAVAHTLLDDFGASAGSNPHPG